jgi:hypothetical protein
MDSVMFSEAPCQGVERRSLGADVAGAMVALRSETLDMS